MIIPKKILIQNFLSISSATIDLADQGLVLIEGVNADDPSANSNGSGKSSLVDAVSWCLYGQTARGATGDAVVNIKAGKNTFVEMEIEIDGDMYHIMRGRKHPTLKNRVQIRRGTTDLTLGTDKLTQARINSLMGCSVDVFNAAIYMGQENMPDLPAMTDKSLKAVLEEALSLNRLDAALQITNDRLHAATENVHAAERLESALRYEVDSLSYRGDRLRDQIAAINAEIKSVQKAINNDKAAMVAQQKEFEDLLASRTKRLKDLGDIQDPAEQARERERCEVEPLRDELEKVRDTYRIIESKLTKVEQDLASPDTCHACGHRLEGDRQQHKAQLREKVTTLKEHAAKYKAAHASLAARITEVKSDIQDDLRAKVAASGEALALQAEITHLTRSIKRPREEWDERHRRQKNILANKKDQLKKMMDDLALVARDLNSNKEHLEATVVRLAASKALVGTLGKVKYALGRKGFRGEVLDHVTPYLNARTQHYLTALTGGAIQAAWDTVSENSDGDYTENFHIQVRHESGVDRFQLLSGGEKRKVRLACALALQDLVATRAVKPIKLFIADEIDDAIDASGLELLMGVLEEKARMMGTVFIISHNDLASYAGNTLTITKRDGVSTFETQ